MAIDDKAMSMGLCKSTTVVVVAAAAAVALANIATVIVADYFFFLKRLASLKSTLQKLTPPSRWPSTTGLLGLRRRAKRACLWLQRSH